jgi:tetratricopeptide (TPR) repeat protein
MGAPGNLVESCSTRRVKTLQLLGLGPFHIFVVSVQFAIKLKRVSSGRATATGRRRRSGRSEPLSTNHSKRFVSEEIHQIPLLVEFYEQYLVDHDIAAFLRNASGHYMVGPLERLVEHGDRAGRRGAILALGRLGDYRSNHVLGRALVDLDRGVRTLAESAIIRVWRRIGAPDHERRLAAVDEQIEEGDFDRAARLASKLIQEAPWIAHSWYQRGKSYFHMGQYDASIRDCQQALEINAYHFQAAAVMGQAYEVLHNLVAALESFRRALRLNPNMEEIRTRVIQLQRTIKDQ